MTAEPAEPTDGRRRKGERRRRLLLDATMAVIGRSGIAAVTQRAVAREADLPASAVTYYFPTVDDLLVSALTRVNDEWLQLLDGCARDPDPIAALAGFVASSTADRRAVAAAEYELVLLAARDPRLREEYARWTTGLDAFLAGHVSDPVRRAGVAAAVDGLFLRCFTDADPPDVAEVRAVLATLLDRTPDASA